MYFNEPSAYAANQVAFYVGQNRDSYTIESHYIEDINTGKITVKHTVVKNWAHPDKKENITYKPGTTFREMLFKGSYKQCRNFIIDIVNKEGEWQEIDGRPYEKRLVFPNYTHF